ncbi:YkgJ family cysteine cluster protein [Mangrovibacterium diazotrophicum]|uniref:Putative zinc-or iron-chelating protein n=1 Tax=Mangrovibacterium diazotrophicum TaxID=1261403 RepID=A0A419W7N0_9BACT|nr:YkgJ family cysteine cluster protein [Mangrovibacterium diazotrophicum]RKD91491.1 putative zinc- or iron-chelating protein [Mangrovibacterium diazotrophicum]
MYRKVQRVQKVLKNAALHTQKFGKNSGITCVSKCHLCCLKKDISASPLEFLPLAYFLYKEGRADEVYDRLEQLPENDLCILFSALGTAAGGCSEYTYRGLICRLFGYASNRDKMGQNRLVTCKPIKESTPYAQLTSKQLVKAPVMSEYYMQLAAIDFGLANEQLQINQAIKRALELVMTYYMYRGRGKRA